MKILVVEDEPTYQEYIRELLEDTSKRFELGSDPEVVLAQTRDDALGLLAAIDDLMLAICDLRVPAHGATVDVDATHGLGVVAHLLDTRPGVPVIIFSAYAEDIAYRIADMANIAPRVALGGGRPALPTFVTRDKGNLREVRSSVDEVFEAYAYVTSVELQTQTDISPPDARILSQALVRQGVRSGIADRLGGGLSGAAAFEVSASDSSGNRIAPSMFVKVGSASEVKDEVGRWAMVSGRLDSGRLAPHVYNIEGLGNGQHAAVFKLEDRLLSLFDFLEREGDWDPSPLVDSLQPLLDGATDSQISVSQRRQSRVGDEHLLRSDLLSLPVIDRCERLEAHVRQAIAHGDLHGENVFVGNDDVVLIDLGDAGRDVVTIDPVALELSLWTHERGRELCDPWPTPEQAAAFDDLSIYLENCPYPRLVRGLREWAASMSGDDQLAFPLAVYFHSVRQLKYEDVDEAVAQAFVTRSAELVVDAAYE